MNDDETLRRAERRAGAKLGFYIHLVVYVTVNLFLIVVNYLTNPDYLWFRWPLMGWGIGLILHWFTVLASPRLMQRLVDKELKKDQPKD